MSWAGALVWDDERDTAQSHDTVLLARDRVGTRDAGSQRPCLTNVHPLRFADVTLKLMAPQLRQIMRGGKSGGLISV